MLLLVAATACAPPEEPEAGERPADSLTWRSVCIESDGTLLNSLETVEARLLEADRAFLQATIDDGLDGWMSFFTEDAARVDLQGGTAVGLDEIREADAPLFEPGGLRLRWEPKTSVALAGGCEGLTRGPYKLIRPVEGAEPEVVGSGNYLSLWRLEDGRFKVYLDTGAPDQPEDELID